MGERKRELVIATASLMFLVAACGKSPFETGISDRTYTNTDFRFQISLPADLADSGWTITRDTRQEIFVAFYSPRQAEGNRGEMGVLLGDLSETEENETPSHYTDEFEKNVRIDFSSYLQESRRSIRINGEDAEEVVFKVEEEDIDSRSIQTVLIKRRVAYIILGNGDSTYFPLEIFRRIVATFKFI